LKVWTLGISTFFTGMLWCDFYGLIQFLGLLLYSFSSVVNLWFDLEGIVWSIPRNSPSVWLSTHWSVFWTLSDVIY
jgi:hypothetical protein